jgi:glutaredoxin
LKEYKVKFEEINLENNQKAVDEMIEKSGQTGVPVLDINGKIVVGFDIEEIKKALKLK